MKGVLAIAGDGPAKDEKTCTADLKSGSPYYPCMVYLPSTIKINQMQVNIPVPWILWGIATRFFLTFLFYYDFFVAIGITLKTKFVFCANIAKSQC